MKLCFNELPPKTKEAMRNIGKMFDERYEEWEPYYFLMEEPNIIARTTSATATITVLAAGGSRGVKDDVVDISVWLKALRIFNVLTYEIKYELMPYILGAQNDTDT